MVHNDSRTGRESEPRCPGFVTALVLRCGQGDEAALVALMELLYAPVCARLAVTTLPSHEAEEIAGRAFVHIWHRAAAYDPSPGADVVAWLLDEAESSQGATSMLAAS